MDDFDKDVEKVYRDLWNDLNRKWLNKEFNEQEWFIHRIAEIMVVQKLQTEAIKNLRRYAVLK